MGLRTKFESVIIGMNTSEEDLAILETRIEDLQTKLLDEKNFSYSLEKENEKLSKDIQLMEIF